MDEKRFNTIFILCYWGGFQSNKERKNALFFSIAYGQNNEVYVTDVYEIDIDNKDIYGKLAERYVKFQDYLVKQGKVTSKKDIQTGYEKNYYKKEQALTEQQHLLSTLEKQQFIPKVVEYQIK